MEVALLIGDGHRWAYRRPREPKCVLPANHSGKGAFMATIHAFETASFAPEMVKTMGEVFEGVWATVEPIFADRKPGEITLVRATLAQRIVWLAKHGHRDPSDLKIMSLNTLAVRMRESAHGK